MNAEEPKLTLAWMCEFRYKWEAIVERLLMSLKKEDAALFRIALAEKYRELTAHFPQMSGSKMVLNDISLALTPLPLFGDGLKTLEVIADTQCVPASEADLVDLAKLFPTSEPAQPSSQTRVFQLVLREVGSNELTHAQLALRTDGQASACFTDSTTGKTWTEIFRVDPAYTNPLRALWTVLDANLRRLVN